MRLMVAPGVWKDYGPESAVSHGGRVRDARPVSNVGGMVPILRGNMVRSPGDVKRNEERQSKRYAIKCGFYMPTAKERCARQPGHRNSHLTARSMREANG